MTHDTRLSIVTGPSGVGKTSLLKHVVEQRAEIYVCVSHTTRQPKKGEREGRDYYFVSQEQFSVMEKNHAFLETATVFGQSYGTSLQEIEQTRPPGTRLVLEIDWQGAQSVRQKIPTQSIFILPPTREVLWERHQGRGRDHPREMQQRYTQALEEISHCLEFDGLLVNDDFATACKELEAFLIEGRCPPPPLELLRQFGHTSLSQRVK